MRWLSIVSRVTDARCSTVPATASIGIPAPHAMPIAAVIHTEAAVVRPLTASFLTKMTPAPRKPIPATICAAMREGSRVTSGPRIAWKPYAETRVNMAEPRPTSVWVRNPALFNRRERSTPIATESTKARARSSSSVSQDSGNKTMSIIGIRRPPSAPRGRRPPGALQNYPLIRGCHVRRPANGRGSRCSDGGSATGEQTDRSARGKLAGMSSAPATASAPVNPRSRVVVASLIGTTIEFYDFYVYATAAVLVFPHLFFPTGDETTALLSSFAVFGAAMVARPLGAVFF